MAIAMMTVSRAAGLALAVLLAGCTDGATRIAYDIQAGAEYLQHEDARTYVVRHIPEANPDGCGGAYDVQLSKASALLIWCKDPETGKVTSSHTTTYHLNFVKVPKTYLLHKNAGDATLIELSKEGGDVVVTDVR